jgi:hypothetical protein
MPLNPTTPDTVKPGRVPTGETASLDALLKGNGFTDLDCRKARSAPGHDADLQSRFGSVMQTEGKFEGSNVTPQKRRAWRVKLEDGYDRLLDAAQLYRDDADKAYQDAVDAEVTQLRTEYPQSNEMYMNIWKGRSQQIKPDARLARWVNADDFRNEIRAAYKARYKPSVAPVSQLSMPEQEVLQTEKDKITAQLKAWANKADDAPGCNDIGTWGTSASGAGDYFAVSQVSRRVWAELVEWWRGKENTCITQSDTSRRSLRKFRDVTDGRSRKFNYHIDIG